MAAADSQAPSQEHHVTLDIGGMTCASCVARIEKSLQGVEGVGHAEVNLVLEKAHVAYDPNVTNPEAFQKAIGGADYPIRFDTITWGVRGLDEAPARDRAHVLLEHMVGVRKVRITPTQGTITVDLMRGVVRPDDVKKTLVKSGYEVSDTGAEMADPKEREAREARIRLGIAVLCTIPLWLAMAKMFIASGPVGLAILGCSWLPRRWSNGDPVGALRDGLG